MAFRSWFRKFVSKIKELLRVHDKYNDFFAEAYFEDGSSMVYTGKPWGHHFEMFKEVAQEASGVYVSMTGSFWRF